jgi:hypothetical protein
MKYNSLLENWNKFLENNEKSVVLINEQTLTPTQFAANIANVAKSPVSKVGAEQETKKVVSDPNSGKELGQLIKSNNFFGAIKYLAQLLKGDDTIELAKVVNLLYPASKQPLKGQVSEQVNPITFASSAAQRALVNLGNGDMQAGLNKFTGYSAFIVVVGMIMTNLMVAWQNKDTSSARDALELIPHLKNSLSLSKSGDLLKFFTDTSSSITEAKKKKAGDRCTRIAKRKYKVWPSAYASGAVVKCRQGKIWKGISENATDEEIDLELLLEEVEVIDEEWSEKYKRSIDCNNPKGFSQKAHCQGRKKNEQLELDDEENHEILEEAKKKRPYKPNFSKEKKQGLHGWFARNKGKGWINCRTGGPCGRSSADKKGGKYPACRPTKAQCKSAGKGPLRKKKSSKPISWVKKKKKD